MFVVKRPFRNLGRVYTAGTVITEPASIKRFKGRLAEGKIIEVTEQTYGATAKYFKQKYGVDLPPISKAAKTPVKEPTKAPVKEPVKSAAKATVKVNAVAK